LESIGLRSSGKRSEVQWSTYESSGKMSDVELIRVNTELWKSLSWSRLEQRAVVRGLK
jgi:hypothetical protein